MGEDYATTSQLLERLKERGIEAEAIKKVDHELVKLKKSRDVFFEKKTTVAWHLRIRGFSTGEYFNNFEVPLNYLFEVAEKIVNKDYKIIKRYFGIFEYIEIDTTLGKIRFRRK